MSVPYPPSKPMVGPSDNSFQKLSLKQSSRSARVADYRSQVRQSCREQKAILLSPSLLPRLTQQQARELLLPRRKQRGYVFYIYAQLYLVLFQNGLGCQ